MNGKTPCIEVIKLTDHEKQLYTLVFSVSQPYFGENRFEILKASQELTVSLITRNAIPQHRVDYFMKPEYKLGRTTKSWFEIFDDNNRGISKYSHPNFLKFLKYFIHGADLPEKIKSDCEDIVSNHMFYRDDSIIELKDYFRKYYAHSNNLNISENLEEKIFQLGLDLGLNLFNAKLLRNYCMKL